MANEISANLSVSINDTGNSISGSSSFNATFSGLFSGDERTVGTTAASLSLGSVTAPVIVMIKNLDTTNFVEIDNVIGLTNFPQKLFPGQAIVLLPLTGTLYAKADTAPCKVLVVAG